MINEFFGDGIAGGLHDVLILCGIVVLMLTTNWKLALLAFIALPMVGAIMRKWRGYAVQTYRATRRTIGIVNTNLAESISGMRVVQSFTREETNLRYFDKLNRGDYEHDRDAARLSGFLFPMVTLQSARAPPASSSSAGGRLVFNESLTIGELVPLHRADRPLLRADPRPQPAIHRAASDDGGGRAIFEVLDVEPEVKNQPGAYAMPPIVGKVDYNGLTFGYGKTEVLHGIDLHVPPRRDGRLRRRDRRGQEFDDQPDHALLRRLGRLTDNRRPRRARRDAAIAPRPTRDRLAGHLPLRRHRARRHPLRSGPAPN